MPRNPSHALNDRIRSSYEAPWPQRLERGKLIAAAVALPLAAVLSAFALEGVRRNEPDTAVGFAGFTLLMSTAAGIVLSGGGFRHLTVSRRVTRDQTSEHENGIHIPHKRDLLLILVLCSLPIATLPVLLPHQRQGDFSLLDEVFQRIGGTVGAAVLGIFSLALFVLSLIIRAPTSLGIYPNGLHLTVRRLIPFFTSTAKHVIEWDHIESITPAFYSGPNSKSPTHHPVIRIDGVVIDVHTGEESGGLEVPVYRLIGEPNTLYRLLRFFHENPDQRGTLSDADSLELLQPPSLLERFRAARTQKAKA